MLHIYYIIPYEDQHTDVSHTVFLILMRNYAKTGSYGFKIQSFFTQMYNMQYVSRNDSTAIKDLFILVVSLFKSDLICITSDIDIF